MTAYLIHYENLNTHEQRYVVQDVPGRKNMSGEPSADGWLGSTNNVSATAMGEFDTIDEAIAAAQLNIDDAPIFLGEYDDGYQQVIVSEEPID